MLPYAGGNTCGAEQVEEAPEEVVEEILEIEEVIKLTIASLKEVVRIRTIESSPSIISRWLVTRPDLRMCCGGLTEKVTKPTMISLGDGYSTVSP